MILDIEKFYVPNLKISSEEDNTDNIVEYSLVLAIKNDLAIANLNIVGNYINTDLDSILLKAVNNVNFKKIILEKSDNSKVFKQITIPYNSSFFKSLEFVDSMYGIYHNGIKIFSDIDKLYIMSDFDHKLDCETKILTIIEDVDQSLNTRGLENTTNILSNNFTYQDLDKINRQTYGNENFYIMENNDGNIIIQKNKKENNDDNGIVRNKIYYQNSCNAFSSDIIEKDKNIYVGFTCNNYDYSEFNCINKFVINDNNHNFKNKKFIVSKSINVFSRTNENIYELTGEFTLKMI